MSEPEARSKSSAHSQSPAQSQSQVQSRTEAYRDYVVSLARALADEMETEYARAIPEYNETKKVVFDGFFEDFDGRLDDRFFAERKAALEKCMAGIPLELAREIIDEYDGAAPNLVWKGVLGIWPADVVRISAGVVANLRKRQCDEIELTLKPKIMADVRDEVWEWVVKTRRWVANCIAMGKREIKLSGTFENWRQDLEEKIEGGYSGPIKFLLECRCKEEDRTNAFWPEIARYNAKAKDLFVTHLTDLGFSVRHEDDSESGGCVNTISW